MMEKSFVKWATVLVVRRAGLLLSQQDFEWRWLSGEPDYFGRNKISSGGDLSHYSSASLY